MVRNLSNQGLLPSRDINVTKLEQEECLDGWSYSKDIYQSTIVSEVNLLFSVFFDMLLKITQVRYKCLYILQPSLVIVIGVDSVS